MFATITLAAPSGSQHFEHPVATQPWLEASTSLSLKIREVTEVTQVTESINHQ